MSDLYSPDSRNYSKYDTMTTQELERILDLYFLFPDDIQDKDLMVHIMEVLTGRDKEIIDANISNLEPSWEDFLNAHPGVTGVFSKPENINVASARSKAVSRKALRRAAGIAAMLVCVLLCGTATAYAAGIDVFSAIAHWTDDTFFFSPTIAGVEDKHIPEQLEPLYEELKSFDAMPLIPSYLPDGYELDKVEAYSGTHEQTVRCLLTKENGCIILNYTFHYTALAFNKYEKDYGDPENVEINGVTVYIFSNVDNYTAAWFDGNTECGIIASSKTELGKIVESLH